MNEKRLRIILAATIVVLILCFGLLYTTLNPPASSNVKITIRSEHHYYTIHYELFLDNNLVKEGNLEPGDSVVYEFTHSFPMGESGTHKLYLYANSTGLPTGITYDGRELTLVHGENYIIELVL